MYPTLEDKDIVFTELGPFSKEDIQKGDIIIINMGDGLKVIKRVVALEGDIIEMREGYLYLNNELQEEDYVNEWDIGYRPADYAPRKVQEDYLFVLGDNRMYSSDSRSYGAIKYSQIQAKSKKVVYPFK